MILFDGDDMVSDRIFIDVVEVLNCSKVVVDVVVFWLFGSCMMFN